MVKREGRRTIFTAFPPRRDMGRALATAGMDRARPKDAGAAVKADAEATAARRTDLRSIILRDDKMRGRLIKIRFWWQHLN